MNYLKNIFQNKKFKYGAFSSITTLFVIAVLFAINLVVSQLNLKYDLSANKLYSISQDSIDIIKSINEPITIYALYPSGQEVQLYKEILEQYPTYNNKINVVYKDPYIYPQFVEAYTKNDEAVQPHSLIIESEKRHKVVNVDDLLTYTLNYETYEYEVTSIDIEPQLTNAIKYVTDDNVATVYSVVGHNETPIPESLIKQFGYANFEYKELDLFLTETVPADCNILLVTTPGRDWTENEAQTVRTYLEKEGRAMFFIDYMQDTYTNLESVLAYYGVELGKALVVEGNSNNIFYGNPIYVIPLNQTHDITSTFSSKGYRTLLPLSRNVEIMQLKRNTLQYEPLLTTSNQSYGKLNSQSQSVNKEEGDLSGPFNVALAVTDSYYTDKQYTTKLVVVGTSMMLDEYVNQYVSGTNADFFINSASWLYNKQTSVYIKGKSMVSTQLVMTFAQANIIALISVIILPVSIFAAGVVVWLRRRNK